MKNFARKKPKPPANLSDEAKKLWRQLIGDFEIDDTAGFLLLHSALEAFDDMRKAQAIIEKDGQVIEDRWGQKKQHPAMLNLRDARNLMLRCLKQLNLDITPGAPLK